MDQVLKATFRQLQTFVAVAETGGFSAAAHRLGVSQAAVSRQVQTLERKLGQALFQRRPGARPVLSDHGAAVFERALGLIEQASGMGTLAAPARAAPRIVRFAAGAHILEDIILPKLSVFHLANPDVEVAFVRFAQDGRTLAEEVEAGRVDVGYMGLTDPVPHHARIISTGRLGLYASPDHPIARTPLDERRTRLPMIMPSGDPSQEAFVRRVLRAAGVGSVTVAMRAQHHATILQLTIDGAGVSCLLEDTAREAVAGLRLVDLGLPLPPLYRSALYRPGALQHEHIRRFDAFVVGLL